MPNQNKKIRSCQKPLYRIQNWSAYEKALIQRGSITFWLSDDLEKIWCHAGEKQRGAQFTYSDQAILIMLTVKEVFHLTHREVEGFMRSLFRLLHIPLTVPDHSTLSKRGQTLNVKLPKKAHGRLNIVLDSTGMKIYGEGEWKVRTHGASKRRTWRKLHVGVDPQSGELQAAVLTENSISDDEMAETLFQQIEHPIAALAADGSYDKRKVYASLHAHSPDARVLIPPRKNAHIWQHGNTRTERLKRDENLRFIRQHGRANWKRESGYHMRSLAETAMFRMKTLFGEHLSARLLETQTTQAMIRCAALNRMAHLGMPQSYKLV
jgi:hypothetical protein